MKFLIYLVAALPAVLTDLMLGNKTDITGTLSETHEAVQFAVEQINAMRTAQNEEPLTLVEIQKAEEQLAAGTNYFLELGMNDRHACRIAVNRRVWFQDDRRLQVVEDPECREVLMGGWSFSEPLPSDENDEIRRALAVAICKADERANAAFASTLAPDASGVTYKSAVTYGITYKFSNVPLVTTTCPHRACDDIDLSDCTIDTDGLRQMCELRIQVAVWDPNPYTASDPTCHPIVG